MQYHLGSLLSLPDIWQIHLRRIVRARALQTRDQRGSSALKLAAPYDKWRPPERLQCRLVPSITCYVAVNLIVPESLVASRSRPASTTMSVPKTSMNKNHDLEAGQHDVRPSR